MNRTIAPILALLLLLTLRGDARAQDSAELARQIQARVDEFSAELERVNLYLTYYDQVQRLGVATGESTPADADARTRGKGSELYKTSFTESDFGALLGNHRTAADAYFTLTENEIRTSQSWAPGTSPASASAGLAAARQAFDALTGAQLDAVSALEEAARARAQARGQAELTPAYNPFAGQAERIAGAIPDPGTRSTLALSQAPVKEDGTGGRDPAATPALPAATPIAQTQPTPIAQPPVGGMPPPMEQYPTPTSDPSMMTPPHAPYPDVMQAYQSASQFYTAGRYAEALPLYDAVIARDAQFRQPRFERAVMRTWTNDLRGSLEDFRLLAADPSDKESRRLRILAEICAGQDMNVARAEAEKLLGEMPRDAAILLVAGQANLWAGDKARGQQLLQQAATADPGMISGLYSQAQSFYAQRVYAVSAVQFTTVVWADPTKTNAYYGMGMSYSGLGSGAAAIEALERFLQSDSTSEWAQSARAEVQRLKASTPR